MAAQVHDGETAGQGQDRRHEESCPCRDEDKDKDKDKEAVAGSRIRPAMTTSGTPPLDDAAMPVFLIEEYESEDDLPPLWEVLMDDQPEFVEELVAAGEDPWEPVLGGWSPGRLSLAGPTPGLFVAPEGEPGLSPAERALVLEAEQLRAALADCRHPIGLGLACVAGIDVQEAVRRLNATPLQGSRLHALQENHLAGCTLDRDMRIVGVTTVPGGCLITQPWGFTPDTPELQKRLSAGTAFYGLYANAKNGNQGSIVRDGVVEGGDLHPGGGPNPYDTLTSEEVLLAYLYRGHPVAHACAWVGLRPTDARAFTGQPDVWVELPGRSY
ncbi:ankyrin repeat domain-containing protein [Streptomyces sp. KLMMK]|uniref:ankyrin repeat domain-containing protein n=1 Tax=Streptomyces sp. KLMMK TaxID=3109353 RepID=UPI002FFFD42F